MNPFNLPEIITKVAHFLPLWKQNQSLGFYDFSPAFLLSCTLVNKTWHDALLPVIWYVYKGDTMRHIPARVLIKNSRYFQLFVHDRSFSGPFLCTHLKELAIIWWDQELIPLVRSNAETLQSLAWKGASSPTRVRASTFPTLDYDLFARMAPNLKSLQLSHWTLSGRRFLQFLSQCKQLTELSLSTVDWTDPTPVASPLAIELQGYGFPVSCQQQQHQQQSSLAYPYYYPLQHTFYRHSSSPPSSPQQQQQQYYHETRSSPSRNLVGIKHLRLDISLSKEDAFIDLVQACHELEFFTLLSETSDDVKTLLPILRQSCPHLRGIDYTPRFNSALGARDYLTDVEYADLVLVCGSPHPQSQSHQFHSLQPHHHRHRLTHLKIDIPWLGEQLTRAILIQSPTLESLNLTFYEDRSRGHHHHHHHHHHNSMVDSIHLGKILEQCVKLKTLSLSFPVQPFGLEETGRMLQGPWACSELETLILSGVTIVGEQQPTFVARSPSPPAQQQQQLGAWPTFPWQMMAGSQGGMIDIGGAAMMPGAGGGGSAGRAQEQQQEQGRNVNHTKQKLCERVHNLSSLKKLSLNSVTFSLDGVTTLLQ
ncbi:hypothetical protein BG004_000417 [Podila humilis]|nr:hypothetical protein BG004_000417 [Podila humilis]